MTVWRFLSGGGVDVIASDQPFRVLHSAADLIDPDLFAAAPRAFLFGRDEVDLIVRDVEPVTDDRPTLEFHLLSRLFAGRGRSGSSLPARAFLSGARPMSSYIQSEIKP